MGRVSPFLPTCVSGVRESAGKREEKGPDPPHPPHRPHLARDDGGTVYPELVLNFDGSCWPNPGGTATWGFVLTGPVGLDVRESGVAEDLAPTNNVAEWAALWMGLSYL